MAEESFFWKRMQQMMFREPQKRMKLKYINEKYGKGSLVE